jgi:hypothetical protein
MAVSNRTKPAEVESNVAQEAQPSILAEAQSLVCGARNMDYGHPKDDFAAVAAAFNAYTHKKYGVICMQAADVPIFQMIVKIMREAQNHKRDNLVDIAGYAATLEMVHDTSGRN